MWNLYVLRCNDGSFYTGMTNDVARRLSEHQAGKGARYTRAHLPVTLVAAWRYPDRAAAMRAERHFKAQPHRVKKSWVEGRWPFEGEPYDFAALGETEAHRFCPRCGGRLELRPVEGRQLQVCTVCGRHHYHNDKPCAGILIVRDGQVLLVHRGREPYKGYWDIPGGFLNPEELPEAGAVREAREETGLDVQLLAFLGFYMDHYVYQGERSAILNIYFVASATGEPEAGDDADSCRWFPLGDLPEEIAFEHEVRVLADLRQWLKKRGKE